MLVCSYGRVYACQALKELYRTANQHVQMAEMRLLMVPEPGKQQQRLTAGRISWQGGARRPQHLGRHRRVVRRYQRPETPPSRAADGIKLTM